VTFDVPLAPDDAYLVLACVGGDNINSDHGVFAEARIVLNEDENDTPVAPAVE
jgi:hypothetical protein